ncbi:GNAT family N-acetyltransferase [Nocardioides sp. zg-536]|uniref:GNAT family N-acetyltransferase n=1 Tax=Nocardioides faecalis TaxID=2803858 RepID=A0A938Y5C8_9ACTN|nr:GNAT family N-acetyltransferase [Nocardioides faecalis]MBM9459509.1 GNAT family N-acetyltransferase [Nocardioides faecalis]QVI58047.1 GNAT family N-acetyltransferase [Nocardioides faecalis]
MSDVSTALTTVVASTTLRATSTARPPAPVPTAPAAPGSLRVVRTKQLGRHTSAWDEMVATTPLSSPFLRSWWLRGVTATDPCYLLVFEDAVLIGGVALDRRWRLGVDRYTMLGAGRLCPDHLDLVAAPHRTGAVALALQTWFSRPGSRILDLDGLRAESALATAVPHAQVRRSATTVWEPLGSAEAYYADRSKNLVRKVRRSRRRLENDGVRFRWIERNELERTLDDFVALHLPRPDRRPLLRRMPELRRTLAAGFDRGEVAVLVAERHGRSCGVLIAFTTGGRLCTYQIARSLDHDLRDVGTLLYAVAVEDACAAGLTEIDLLRGDEDYKWTLASRSRDLHRLRASYGVLGRLALAGTELAERVRPVLGRLRRSTKEALR